MILDGDGVIYAGSPRANGNTDVAAMCLLEGASLAGKKAVILHTRDYAVLPCTGCSKCAVFPNTCVLDSQDCPPSSMDILFKPFFTTQILFFAAPVYFYHFPAHFKAIMDRTQRFYCMRQNTSSAVSVLRPKTAYPVLLGARTGGASLFDGCLRSLRLMLDIFNIRLAPPLLLRGLENMNDLARNPELKSSIIAYAKDAFQSSEKVLP